MRNLFDDNSDDDRSKPPPPPKIPQKKAIAFKPFKSDMSMPTTDVDHDTMFPMISNQSGSQAQHANASTASASASPTAPPTQQQSSPTGSEGKTTEPSPPKDGAPKDASKETNATATPSATTTTDAGQGGKLSASNEEITAARVVAPPMPGVPSPTTQPETNANANAGGPRVMYVQPQVLQNIFKMPPPRPPNPQPPLIAPDKYPKSMQAPPPHTEHPPIVATFLGSGETNAFAQFMQQPLAQMGMTGGNNQIVILHQQQPHQQQQPGTLMHEALREPQVFPQAMWGQPLRNAGDATPAPQQPGQGTVTLEAPSVPHVVVQFAMPPPPKDPPRIDALPEMGSAPTLNLPELPPVALPAPPDSAALQQLRQDEQAWDAFTQLRKQLEDSHQRTLNLHGEISRAQVAHEREAAQYQKTTGDQVEKMRKDLEALNDKNNELQASLDTLTGILQRKAQEIRVLEQTVNEKTVDHSAMAQKVAHIEDRVRLADNARQVAEVRARELELSLEHATGLVMSLRTQLHNANDDKAAALQKQHKDLEQNRQDIMKFYADREQHLYANYNETLRKALAQVDTLMKERERQVALHWECVFKEQFIEQQKLAQELQTRADMHNKDISEIRAKQEVEKDKWIAHMQREIQLADQRGREREEHVLMDIARRERELGEREQKMRVMVAQGEQDAKIALLTREAELKSYYEKMLEDVRKAYDDERDRLVTSFRDQIATIGNQHKQNEDSLEKMHRDKEREMAARYKIAGYEMDDQKSAAALQGVAARTQESLLSKFDKMESRQRERAETTRVTLLGARTKTGEGEK